MNDAYKVTMINNLKGEIWKPVFGWEDLYQVSNYGRVKSLSKNIILKSSNIVGYRQVVLCRNGTMVSGRVHRLVATAFIPNPNSNPEVNHKDGVKYNNQLSNLEWVTPSENVQHTYSKLGRIGVHGQTHSKAKLTNTQVRDIRKKYIPYKYSYQKLGDEYGLDQSTIWAIVKRKIWKQLV